MECLIRMKSEDYQWRLFNEDEIWNWELNKSLNVESDVTWNEKYNESNESDVNWIECENWTRYMSIKWWIDRTMSWQARCQLIWHIDLEFNEQWNVSRRKKQLEFMKSRVCWKQFVDEEVWDRTKNGVWNNKMRRVWAKID